MVRLHRPSACCSESMRSVLIDSSLTVKAATLIFISGRGSAISSAKEGKLGSIIIWKRVNKLLGRANVRVYHESPDRIYTDLTCINP